ncbi:hypothetical protein ACP4OV_013479 [Aristida adscensionis]
MAGDGGGRHGAGNLHGRQARAVKVSCRRAYPLSATHGWPIGAAVDFRLVCPGCILKACCRARRCAGQVDFIWQGARCIRKQIKVIPAICPAIPTTILGAYAQDIDFQSYISDRPRLSARSLNNR